MLHSTKLTCSEKKRLHWDQLSPVQRAQRKKEQAAAVPLRSVLAQDSPNCVRSKSPYRSPICNRPEPTCGPQHNSGDSSCSATFENSCPTSCCAPGILSKNFSLLQSNSLRLDSIEQRFAVRYAEPASGSSHNPLTHSPGILPNPTCKILLPNGDPVDMQLKYQNSENTFYQDRSGISVRVPRTPAFLVTAETQTDASRADGCFQTDLSYDTMSCSGQLHEQREPQIEMESRTIMACFDDIDLLQKNFDLFSSRIVELQSRNTLFQRL